MDAVDPMTVVGNRTKELRARKDLTAQELGEKMTEAGFRWDRFTVANLESGKRKSVTVPELLGLARVLDVAPVHLMVPLEKAVPFRVTPHEVWPAHRVRAWVRGETPLPSTDRRTFSSEKPLEELEDEGRFRDLNSEERALIRRVIDSQVDDEGRGADG